MLGKLAKCWERGEIKLHSYHLTDLWVKDFVRAKAKGKITKDKFNKLNYINIIFLYIKNILTKLKGEWPTMENIYNKDDRRWIFFNYIKLLHNNKEEKNTQHPAKQMSKEPQQFVKKHSYLKSINVLENCIFILKKLFLMLGISRCQACGDAGSVIVFYCKCKLAGHRASHLKLLSRVLKCSYFLIQ